MEGIFNKIAGKKMIEWDINSFKKSHKKLYESIIGSMFTVEKVTTDLERKRRDRFAIGFVEWKDKISDADLKYSTKYAKSNEELLKIYKTENEL